MGRLKWSFLLCHFSRTASFRTGELNGSLSGFTRFILLPTIMDYSHALQRLRNHANVAGIALPEHESFLFALGQAEREEHPPDLRSLFDDILSCFEAVNHALNTPHPSGTISGKAEALPRFLVPDVSAILSVGWHYALQWSSSQKFSEPFRTELATMLEQMGIAWGAVLDGDIDDIREHIQQNFWPEISRSKEIEKPIIG
jgi:hypothetical protein